VADVGHYIKAVFLATLDWPTAPYQTALFYLFSNMMVGVGRYSFKAFKKIK
jgi:hypothetical protein